MKRNPGLVIIITCIVLLVIGIATGEVGCPKKSEGQEKIKISEQLSLDEWLRIGKVDYQREYIVSGLLKVYREYVATLDIDSIVYRPTENITIVHGHDTPFFVGFMAFLERKHAVKTTGGK